MDKLKKIAESKEEVHADMIYALTTPEGLPDGDKVVPVDLRGVSENFAKDFEDDFDIMIEKLGAKGAASGLLKAHEYFKKNKGNDPEDDRATTITVKEWKAMLEDDGFGDEDEEEEDDAGAEDEEEEEEGGEDDEDE